MEKERLQGLLRENRFPANRRGFYGQHTHNLEGKIADEAKEINDNYISICYIYKDEKSYCINRFIFKTYL